MPLVCVLLTVLLGCAALAIDLGRLHYTAAEAQAAADAAALAAVSASQSDPTNGGQAAPTRAQLLAGRNRAAGAPGSVAAADVLPMFYDPDARSAAATTWGGTVNSVQVTTRAQPGYAFAGMLGLTANAVARRATAWIANANGASCVRPFALPYTRIYEDALGLKAKDYSAKNRYAPDFTQAQVAAVAQLDPPVARTFVLIPPSEDEKTWDNKGKPNSGSWHTIDFNGAGYSAFATYIGAPVGSLACSPASTEVGEYLRPFSWKKETFEDVVLGAATPGFVRLCNRAGTLPDARCRDARGRVGVKTRVSFADSIPNKTGPFSQKVRMVSQVRLMCYFQSEADVCAATPSITASGATEPWQMPPATPTGPPVDRGYPAGTVVVMLDAPVSVDLTADVVLGNTISFTQRLLLVK